MRSWLAGVTAANPMQVRTALLALAFGCPFACNVSQALAIDLVGADLGTVTARASLSVATSPTSSFSCTGPDVTLAQGETATVDASCNGYDVKLEVRVSSNQVLARLAQPLASNETAWVSVGIANLIAPDLGFPTTPIVFETLPLPTRCYLNDPRVLTAVGGSIPSSAEGGLKFTVFALAGDSLITQGDVGSCQFQPQDVEQVAVLGTWTVSVAQSAPECNDQIDNDGDGTIDLADADCADADDTSELRAFNTAGWGCGIGPELAALVALLYGARRWLHGSGRA